MSAETNIPSGQTPIGRLLRSPLKLVPKNAVVPIMSGPARGFRWIVGARKLLEIHRPVVFLAIDADSDYDCCNFLRTLGYQVEEFEQNEIISTTEA